jgi:hypothetical protein
MIDAVRGNRRLVGTLGGTTHSATRPEEQPCPQETAKLVFGRDDRYAETGLLKGLKQSGCTKKCRIIHHDFLPTFLVKKVIPGNSMN